MENQQTEGQSKTSKISPQSILRSSAKLRIEPGRITIPECSLAKRGASADVQLAILVMPPKILTRSLALPEIRFIVALKKFRLDDDSGHKAGLVPFAHELSLLSKLANENIVNLVGFVEEADRGIAWIVFPWAGNGNLREFVRSQSWELPERTSLVNDVLCGMRYLHTRPDPICHGDLKSLNILINESCRAVISDFGSARILKPLESTSRVARRDKSARTPKQPIEGPSVEFSVHTKSITLSGPAWTIRWAAPELLNGECPSLATDVWALGWICWEALTGNFPFDSVVNQNEVIIQIIEGNIPNITEDPHLSQFNSVCKLIKRCWDMDPQNRPSAAKCHSYMANLSIVVPADVRDIEGERIRSFRLLDAISQTHIQEGRLGEGIRYLVKSWVAAQDHPVTQLSARTNFEQQLLKHRRSTYSLETVAEEEAVRAWNMAVELTAAQMFVEAERHLLHAALCYRILGFQTQISDCSQFHDGLRDVTRPLSPPRRIGRWIESRPAKTLGTIIRWERIPKISHPIYSQEYGQMDLIWFVAGALEHASPESLEVHEIFEVIERYQPWRIEKALERDKKDIVVAEMQALLSNSPAFTPVTELRWCLTQLDHLPGRDMLPYEISLGLLAEAFDALQKPWPKGRVYESSSNHLKACSTLRSRLLTAARALLTKRGSPK